MDREIKYIVLHCTATHGNVKVKSILNYWKKRLGWKNPGYHFIIQTDGKVTQLQPIELPTNGVRGYNKESIHVSYIGGVDKDGRSKDTRTKAQRDSMTAEVKKLNRQFPTAEIKGHRDFPKVKKSCPSFEVKDYLKEIGICG